MNAKKSRFSHNLPSLPAKTRRDPVAEKFPTYLTLAEAAVVLRCSRRTMFRYIRDGKVSFLRIGKRYLFSPEDMRMPSRRLARWEDILA